MFDWLKRILEAAARAVPAPVANLIQWSLEGIGSVLGNVSHTVSDAWHELVIGLDALRHGAFVFGEEILGKLEQIVQHWIPRFAITAWWWVTHPAQLAAQLVLYLVAQLEAQAWTLGQYLGEFVLALVAHNVRRVALLAETILTAIL